MPRSRRFPRGWRPIWPRSTARTVEPVDVEENRPRYRIESVAAALRMLLLLQATPELRVTTAARELGIAPSRAHRLLTTLAGRRFVTQDRVTKSYRAGPALIELGVRSTGAFDLRAAAEPHLRATTQVLGATVNLLVQIGRASCREREDIWERAAT